MSHYTTQLRYIIEDYTQGFTGSLSNRIQAAAPLIFDFPYPIWKEDYRLTLETKILRHYFNKEIGLETEGLWKFYLETRMNEIMPYYNKLYETVEKQYNWLWDTNLNEDFLGTGTTHNESDLNGNVHSTENMDETKDTIGHTNAQDNDLVNRNGTENEIYDRDDATNIDKDTSFEEEVERITAETEKYQLGRLHDASYGSMIPVASLENGNFDDYTKLFIEIPFLIQKNGLHIQSGGTYLRAFHKGGWDKIPMRYQELLNYAKKHHLKLSGYSYEMGMNENVIDCIEDYIVQIEIPVSNA